MRLRTPLTELLEEDSGFCIFGAETLLGRLGELQAQIAGAKKGEDIEYIHKLRVASRRVRTALSIFEDCLPGKKVKRWSSTVRNVTVSCGAARDADVQLAFLQNYTTHLDARAAAGLRYLIGVQQTRRRRMQSEIIKALDSLEASGVLTEILQSCDAIRNNADRKKNVKTILTYRNAQAHIMARLDEVLGLGEFVHDPTAVTKHHKLRIAAKRLRYTMEAFAPIYTDGLSDHIALMKKFQDLLGEMHDYYVWTQDLTPYRREIPPDARYGLNRLLVHLNELSQARYAAFVSLWDDALSKHLFTKMRQEIDTGPGSRIVREILNHTRRVAVISDVHGNIDALEAVVKDAKSAGLDMFLNAADAVGFGIYPSQVVQTLRSPNFLNVLGNVDLETLEAMHNESKKTGAEEAVVGGLSQFDIDYLQSLPRELRLEIAGKHVLVTHGSPESIAEHIYPDAPERRLRQIARKASADLIITGHTHLQMNRKVDGVTFLNPGSVGRPVDGDPRAEYAILGFEPLTVEFRRVEYDVQSLVREMRRLCPESYAQRLLRGLKLEVIEKQDRALAKKHLWMNRSTIKAVRRIAASFPSDQLHAEQDRRIALSLFDGTKSLHSLGAEERYWLECAAILHDLGMSWGQKGQHKSSLEIILNDANLPFTMKERYIIGSIARYHRKALPDDGHFNLAPLSENLRRKVTALSAILRLADALDSSHQSIVRKVNVKPFTHHIILECLVSDDCTTEGQSVRRKKDLFEQFFKKDLIVVWKSQAPDDKSKLPSPLESNVPSSYPVP